MADQSVQPDPSFKPVDTDKNLIYTVENKLPIGSVDKAKAERDIPDEQYPIPFAKPIPWADEE